MPKLKDNYYFRIIGYLRFFKTDVFFLMLITGIRIALAFPLPGAIQSFFDSLGEKQEGSFIANILLVSFLLLANVIVGYFGNLKLQKIGYGLTYLIRKNLLKKILEIPYAEVIDFKTGDVVSRITGDTMLFKEFIMSIVIDPIISMLLLSVYIIILFKINVYLTLAILVTFPILSLVIKIYHRKTMKASFDYRDKYSEVYIKLLEIFNGLKLIKSMKYENRHEKEMDNNFEVLSNAGIKMENLGSKSSSMSSFIINCGLLAVLVLGGYFTSNGTMTLAGFISFYMFLQLAYNPIDSITLAFSFYQKASGMMNRVFEILNHNTGKISGKIKSEKSEKFFNGDINIRDLSFSYDGNTKIFDKFSCKFLKNSINVVMGHSGAGKTTLFDLLLKLYSPDEGSVLVDDINLNDVSHEEYAKHIGVFTQDPFILDTTIEENIRYYSPDSSLEDVIKAAKEAHIDEYVQLLEDKYDTMTGERGNRLSGGEKARIAMARIFLKKPAIIFLDEPTSNIDSQTEKIIYDSLIKLRQTSTIIMIAHKESAKDIADNIVDLNEVRCLE